MQDVTSFVYWKSISKRVADPEDEMEFEGSGLTRWIMLNTLPYWGDLLIRHLLDPMHIEGNVGKALMRALYGDRDSHFREACEELEKHPNVWVTVDEDTGLETYPSAPWMLDI